MKILLGSVAPDDSYKVVGYRKNLDDICEDGECSEINAVEMLDFIEYPNHRDFILHLVKKLRHDGVLYIGGTDIVNFSLGVFNKSIPLDKANEIMFGTANTPVKVGVTCLEEVRKILLTTELRITKQICEPNFIIGARRP